MTTKVEPTVEKWELKPEVQKFIDTCKTIRDWNEQGELGLDEQRIGVWAARINELVSLSVQEAKAEMIQKIEGMKVNVEDEGNMRIARKRPIMGIAPASGYNQALDDLLASLKQEDKK